MNRTKLIFLLFVGTASLLLYGCPTPPAPPFDATGTYTGSWSGTSTDQAQQVAQCPLTLTLTQAINGTYPGNHVVSGTTTIDYSCITFPSWVQTPPPSTVDVGGILQDNGHLTLLSGGCTTALCVVLDLDGDGHDTNSDGHMDTYSGSWTYTILLAGVQPFGFGGTFTVALQS